MTLWIFIMWAANKDFTTPAINMNQDGPSENQL